MNERQKELVIHSLKVILTYTESVCNVCNNLIKVLEGMEEDGEYKQRTDN